MNIFTLDLDVQKAAEYHCDKHVVKMILESAQMISTVFDKYGEHQSYMLKPCFQNHPCTLWAGKSFENLHWLIGLGYFLTKEYYKRYKKVHKYNDFFHSVIKHQHYLIDKFPEEGLQPFAIAMPDYLKIKLVKIIVSRKLLNYIVSIISWRKIDLPFGSIQKCLSGIVKVK